MNRGDIVLVPTMDREKKREVIREATVVDGNYKIDPDTLPTPLKKIIKVIKRKMIEIITPNVGAAAESAEALKEGEDTAE